jgi:hypothetical protein
MRNCSIRSRPALWRARALLNADWSVSQRSLLSQGATIRRIGLPRSGEAGSDAVSLLGPVAAIMVLKQVV